MKPARFGVTSFFRSAATWIIISAIFDKIVPQAVPYKQPGLQIGKLKFLGNMLQYSLSKVGHILCPHSAGDKGNAAPPQHENLYDVCCLKLFSGIDATSNESYFQAN